MKVIQLTPGGKKHIARLTQERYVYKDPNACSIPGKWSVSPHYVIDCKRDGQYELDDLRVVDGEPDCKICRKIAKIDVTPPTCTRFIVKDKETNLYCKSTSRFMAWTPFAIDAFMFKSKRGNRFDTASCREGKSRYEFIEVCMTII